MWGESHVVFAKSFVFHYTICILVKQVCTVLSLHFHHSGDSSAESEKEAFVLPSVPACSLPGSLSRSLTPTGKNFLPSLISSVAHAWLWFMGLVTRLHGAKLDFLSRKLFNYFQDKREGSQILFSITIGVEKETTILLSTVLHTVQGALSDKTCYRHILLLGSTPLCPFFR